MFNPIIRGWINYYGRYRATRPFVRNNGEINYLWRAVDHEGEVLDAVVTKKRDRKAARKVLKRLLQRYGRPMTIVTDRLRSYQAALRDIGHNHFNHDRHLNRRLQEVAANASWRTPDGSRVIHGGKRRYLAPRTGQT